MKGPFKNILYWQICSLPPYLWKSPSNSVCLWEERLFALWLCISDKCHLVQVCSQQSTFTHNRKIRVCVVGWNRHEKHIEHEHRHTPTGVNVDRDWLEACIVVCVSYWGKLFTFAHLSSVFVSVNRETRSICLWPSKHGSNQDTPGVINCGKGPNLWIICR